MITLAIRLIVIIFLNCGPFGWSITGLCEDKLYALGCRSGNKRKIKHCNFERIRNPLYMACELFVTRASPDRARPCGGARAAPKRCQRGVTADPYILSGCITTVSVQRTIKTKHKNVQVREYLCLITIFFTL